LIASLIAAWMHASVGQWLAIWMTEGALAVSIGIWRCGASFGSGFADVVGSVAQVRV